MNKVEAESILVQQLASFTQRSYGDLVAVIDIPHVTQAKAPSGCTYNIEFNVFYDDPDQKQDLRIMGSIDDGKFGSSVSPLTKDEIMKPTGELV